MRSGAFAGYDKQPRDPEEPARTPQYVGYLSSDLWNK